MVNKYKGTCEHCGGTVPAYGGNLRKVGRRWLVSHLACQEQNGPAVHVTRFSSGAEIIQNARGRCEDAPCCGCCS
jgi:hypothetical protein